MLKRRLLLGAFYLASWMPRSFAQWLGQLLGKVLWLTNSEARRVTEINVGLCYASHSEAEREMLVRQSLIATAMTALETPSVWLGKREKLARWIAATHGLEAFDALCGQGRGVLLIVPHIGNWELFNAYHAARGKRLTALFRPPRQAPLAGIIHYLRVQFGNHMVPTTARGIVQLFKRLQRGEVVAVLPDQVPESGVFASFFGQAALTDRLAHRLVQKTDASVVMMGLLRNEDGLFDLHLVPIDGLNNPDEDEALSELNLAIQQLVQRAPAQYQWEYKRFKRQPHGARDPYLKS